MARTPLLDKLVQAVRTAAAAEARGVPVEAVLEDRARRMGRREVLGKVALGGAAVAGAAALPRLARAQTVSSPRIAVVGGGLAGLTAAHRLRQAGWAATVYEANTRLGGRCYTGRGAFAEGQIHERGGELIDQYHKQIRQLVQELGLDTDNLLAAEQNGTEPFYWFDGAPYTYAQATDDIKQIWQKLHSDVSAASYPTLHDSYTQRGWELDHMSIRDWIEESVPGGSASPLGQLLDVAYEIEYGAEIEDQSALNLLYLLGYSGQGQLRIFGPSNEKYHVRGGNDRIVSELAARLSGQIETGARLAAIVREPDGRYTLTFQRGSGTFTRRVEKVILAVPFSILRASVDFRRAGFSALKETAIRELGMGANTKLQLQFATRRWRALGNNGDTYSDRGYQVTWEVTRGQAGTAGILNDYTGGAIARSFEKGTLADQAQRFLAQVEPVLPGLSAVWNGRATVDVWSANPWTRGAYSYWRVGDYTRFAGAEGERSFDCHFCGEHTSIDSQGYLNGAVETGERAAAEVAADLRLWAKA
jgi:monoamine oxidase